MRLRSIEGQGVSVDVVDIGPDHPAVSLIVGESTPVYLLEGTADALRLALEAACLEIRVRVLRMDRKAGGR